MVSLSFGDNVGRGEEPIIIPVFSDDSALPDVEGLDPADVAGYLAANKAFKGSAGQVFSTVHHGETGFRNIIFVGMGNKADLDRARVESVAGPLHKKIKSLGHKDIAIMSDLAVSTPMENAEFGVLLADALKLADYRYNDCKSDAHKSEQAVGRVNVITADHVRAREIYADLIHISNGTMIARDLSNEPSATLYPQSYAEKIQALLGTEGVTITVLEEEEMKDMGMGLITAVGQGSTKERQPRMVIMEYDGTGGADVQPFGLVGKGVTYDTGGMNVKTQKMESMKMDMGGSAAVVGTMHALASMKAPVKVVAIVGLADNDIGPEAYRPGDVVTSLSGKTIEILNTDAEGRLVMADCLTYLQNEFDPHTVIDIATLTGAVIAALGTKFAGVMSNDDDLAELIDQSGYDTNELNWRMPLHEVFTNALKGQTGDYYNMGPGQPGTCTAGAFLQLFIDEGRPWAHVDIAGTAGVLGKSATGYGVKLLTQVIMQDAAYKSVQPTPTYHVPPTNPDGPSIDAP